MTEAIVATNDYWFQTLGFPLLRVAKALGNAASRRISEKTGMRFVEETEKQSVSGPARSQIWEQTAEDWAAHRASVMQVPPNRLRGT